MLDLSQATHRRRFLGTAAAGAASLLGLATLTKAGPHAPMAAPSRLRPDTGDAAFEAWLGKITGKHRQLFDAPSTNQGMPFAWARVFLMSNKQAGVPENDVSVVIVMRHEGIPAAMTHELWSKYKFGELFKVTDGATKAPALRNPFYQPKPGEQLLPDMSIEDLQTSGVLMGVCDMALTVYSSMVAKKMSMAPEDVKKEWVGGLLPGIQIVPSGVYAVNRTQEHGCAYCFAG